MKPSILIAISQWVMKNFRVGESLKEVGTEILQKCLWIPLKNKIINFFSSEKETDEFIEQLITTEAKNVQKPERDVEDLYETIKGETPSKSLFDSIAAFLCENQELIKQMNLASNSSSDTITYFQKAENIYNNKGVQNITIIPKKNK